MFPNALTKSLHSNARCSLPFVKVHPLALLSRSFTSASVSFLAAGMTAPSKTNSNHYAARRNRRQEDRCRLPSLLTAGSTHKVRRIVRITAAFVLRDLRIGAQRPCHLYIPL